MSMLGLGGVQNYLNQYVSLYGQTMAAAQQQYSDVLNGYNSVMNQIAPEQAAVAAGYGGVESQVMNTIQGIGASQRQQIQDVYAQQSGQAAQGLINRGLGNTTVANSVQRGLTLDQQKAQIALSNQLAQLTAGYQANIGMAGLNYRGQALAGNQQFAQGMYGAASRVNFPQPQASPFGAAIGAAAQYGRGGGGGGGLYGGGGALAPGGFNGTAGMQAGPGGGYAPAIGPPNPMNNFGMGTGAGIPGDESGGNAYLLGTGAPGFGDALSSMPALAPSGGYASQEPTPDLMTPWQPQSSYAAPAPTDNSGYDTSGDYSGGEF